MKKWIYLGILVIQHKICIAAELTNEKDIQNLKPSKAVTQEAEQIEEAQEENQKYQSQNPNSNSAVSLSAQLKDLILAAKKNSNKAESYLASDLFFKASMASLYGEWETSKSIYKELVELVPNDNFLKMKLVESYIRVGQLIEAKTLLANTLSWEKRKKSFGLEKLSDQEIDSILLLAGLFSALLEKNEARTIYQSLINTSKVREEACVFLSKSYVEELNFSEAINTINQCLKKTKEKTSLSTLLFYKGKILLQKSDISNAKKNFRLSNKSNPQNLSSIIALGTILEEEQNYFQAKKLYLDSLKINPNNLQILNKIIPLLISHFDHLEAISYLKVQLEIEPDDLNNKAKLGVLLTEKGLIDEAEKIFEDLLIHVPNSDKILFYLGSINLEKGELERAIEKFSQIPPDGNLYQAGQLQMAQILMTLAANDSKINFQKENFHIDPKESSNLERFLSFINEKEKLTPELKVPLKLLQANFYELKENTNEAISVLESIKDDKNFDNNHRYYLATLHEKAQNFNKAQEIGLKIVEGDPDNAQAWNFLGYSLLERGTDLKKAHEYIQKALKLNPHDGYIRDSLGWLYFKTGKTELALKEIQLAHQLSGDDSVIMTHLALVHFALKNASEAKKYFRLALKNTKVEAERQNVLKSMEEITLNEITEQNERLPANIKSEDQFPPP